jgi:hypothetical protein
MERIAAALALEAERAASTTGFCDNIFGVARS